MKRKTTGHGIFTLPVLLIVMNLQGHAQSLPIKPTRTISFTTDEGTYMNVDVSPDGKTLLFDLLGDLYSVPSTGGDATQLTRGIALNLRPVWSPDGKRIAYISDTSGDFQLNVRDIKGKFHYVLGKQDLELYKRDPVWTPDGHYICIDGSIFGIAGGSLPPQTGCSHPIRFSEEGRLAYYLDSGKIYRHDNIQKTSTAISPVLGRAENGTLSPDGRWWAYLTDSNVRRCLMVRDLQNGRDQLLVPTLFNEPSTYRPDRPYRPSVPSAHYAFSPDSKDLYIGYGGRIHRIDVASGADQVVPFIARVKADLGPFNYNTFRVTHDSVKVRYTRSARVRPDGRQVVFSTLNKLYVMDLPGGKPHELAPQAISQFQPVYSPDGKWLAYVSWSDTAGGGLWRVPAAGGRPEQLTNIPGHYQRPAWSPDGALIAVVKGEPKFGSRDDPGKGQLELVPVNGGPIQIIDENIPLWNHLSFSSDGTRINYQPKNLEIDGSPYISQLVSKDLDGKDLRVLAVGREFRFLQQMSISPDGRYLVYSADEDLYLLPVCSSKDTQVIYDPWQRIPAIKFAAGVDPYWEKNGGLTWTYGNHLYRVDPEKIVGKAELEMQKMPPSEQKKIITAWVSPDQVIPLDLTVPAFYAHGMIALRDIRIITMRGDQVIEHGTILIKDGRFTALGPMGTIPIPPGVKVIDLPGSTIIPGLVDLHLHMGIPPNVFPQQSWMFLVNLAYGVTTARDPSLSFDSYGYKELLESGQMIGPRLFTVGRAARIDDGMIRCESIEDARALAHKRAVLGGTVVKQYMLATRQQRQWMVQACREAGLNMTNEGASDPIMQVGMMKDGSTGIEHNPEWGDIYNDMVAFVTASRTWLTPALQVSYGVEFGKEYFKYKYWRSPDKKLAHFTFSDPRIFATESGPESLETILHGDPKDTVHPGFLAPARIDARLRKAGGRVTMGSHGNDEGIGAHNELWALQMGGISNMQALQAATIMGAEALGVQKDLGSIEVGKIADLVILNKNPLEDIHNSREIRYVMKDGVLYDGDTLDMIWPMAKKCPEWKLKTGH